MKKRVAVAITTVWMVVGAYGQAGYTPPDGFVPDAMTAVKIAEAVLTPIYGEAVIQSERPFKAQLKDGVWEVNGHLPQGYDIGGTAQISIDRKDGRILHVIHYK